MPAPLHLLVVTTNYAETEGGVEMHLRELLPRLVDRGVVVTVVYLGARGEPWVESSGVTVIPLRRWFDFRNIIALPDPRQWRRFGRHPHETPVTHVATHTRFFPLSYSGIRLAKRLGVPSVHTEHGGGYVVTSSPLVRFASRAVDLTLGRHVLRHASAVVGVSEVTRRFVRQLSGVTALRFTNGINLQAWLPSINEASEPDTAERRLVFIGRVVAEKGWRTFLDIVAGCQRQGWTGEAWLIGDGIEREKALEYAQQQGIRGLVAPGHLPSDHVRDALRQAVYVNPSVASEGFQLTLVEALAAGASVATYRVGVAPELAVVPGAAISVVEVGDADALGRAVQDLLATPPPTPTRQQYAPWDWESVADSYVQIMRDLEDVEQDR